MNIERIGDAVVIDSELFHYEQVGSVSKLIVHKKVESLRILKTVVKQLVKTIAEAEKEK